MRLFFTDDISMESVPIFEQPLQISTAVPIYIYFYSFPLIKHALANVFIVGKISINSTPFFPI